MSLKYHTVIFVPHERARFRKLRISTRRLRFLLAFFVVATVSAVFFAWAYFTTTVDRGELERLYAENRTLESVNASFDANIEALRERLAEYEERTRQLAIVAGIDSLEPATEAGVGGDDVAYDVGRILAPLEARSERLESELALVERGLEERGLRIAATPAIAPVKGLLTSGFGHRRDPVTGRRVFHPAVDIAAPPGRPVRATGDGIVVQAGWMGALGRAVFISHGFGVKTRYGHLSRTSVQPGDRVRRGDIVGYVGSSGRSTGYHVHYEVQVDGQAMNPLAYILDGTAPN